MMSIIMKSSLRQNHRHCFSTIPLPKDQNLINLLNSCYKTTQLSQIHSSLITSGFANEPFKLSKLLASSSLLNIHYASSIFNHIQKPNLFMFSTMLRGYSVAVGDHYYPKQALLLFNQMRRNVNVDVLLDQFCFVSVIKSCARLCAVSYGQGVHSIVIRSGFYRIVNIRNGLMKFYCVSGLADIARQVFDEFPINRDLVSWATLMDGYLNSSRPLFVVDLFMKLYRSGLRINVSTILSVVSAANHLDDVFWGELLHGYCVKVRLCLHTKVVTAFIAMYADLGHVGLAERVFDEAYVKDIVAWNCLISRYARYGEIEKALALVESMKSTKLKPNSSTLAGLISACVANEALSIGQRICRYIEEEGFVTDTVLGTAITDLYCKSGWLQKAISVFNQIENKDVKTWTTMISGCGMNGKAKEAVTFLENMKKENIIPNGVTFLVALNACSHGGLISEGIQCFESMVRDYNLTPKVEHYGCIIDLLGRAGLLHEAYELIRSLHLEIDETVWRSLLAACRVYGNVELAEHVKKVLNEMCGEHPCDEMVLSGTYAIAGRVPMGLGFGYMEKGSKIRGDDDVMSGVKETGLSMIELDWQADLKEINWLICN